LYAQLLIAASFVAASYQDVTERAVSDLVWVPALAGAVYSIYELYSSFGFQSFELSILKLVLIGGISLAFAFFGGIGEADAIAMVFIAADPYPLSPIAPLVAAAAVAISHIAYEYMVGNARGVKTIPMEQFLKEQRWIPKAIVTSDGRTEVSRDVNDAREEVEAKKTPGASVEVSYGVPTVAYLGIGYAIFLVYLALTNFAVFSSLP
jgi:hypothetical protein